MFAQVSGLESALVICPNAPEQWRCGTFVAHRHGSTACSICSGSIPLESDGVAVTVTATGATRENSDAGQEHDHPHKCREEDACHRRWGCEFSARSRDLHRTGIRDTPLSRKRPMGRSHVDVPLSGLTLISMRVTSMGPTI